MIPAALLIIVIPLAAAAPAYFLRRWRLIETFSAFTACAVVILILAWPADTPLRIAGFAIDTQAPVNLLGRELAVRIFDRFPLILLFASALLLFGLGWSVSQGWTFVPFGLGILSLLSAALLIRPFVFAGLAFEAAAALGAVMVQAERSGERTVIGALRYLVISTLALPAFLGAGYAVTQAGGISDPALQAAAYGPAIILLGIALGLLMGAFPLYTWTHTVSNDAPPLTTVFLATIGTGAATFLFLSFQQDFSWFRDGDDIRIIANLLGIATLLVGLLLGWAQRSFRRTLACGLSVEIGSTLLLLNSHTPLSVEALSFSIAARALSMGLFGLGIALLRERTGSDEFAAIAGTGKNHWWAAVAITVGGLSMAGLPGTIGFVSRWTTARVVGQTDLEALVLILLAGASVGAGVLRGILAMYSPARRADQTVLPALPRKAAITVAVTVILVVGLGILPGATAPVTKAIAENYTFYK